MRWAQKRGGPRGLRKGHARNRKLAVAYLVLLITVLFSIWYSISYMDAPSDLDDDTAYMQEAMLFGAGHLVESQTSILSLRVMMLLPIAISYSLFGFSQVSSALWDIASFIGTIIVAFFIGRELAGERTGAIAAVLLAFVPQAASLATTVDDAVPLMFITSLVMLCLIVGRKRSSPIAYFLTGALLVATLLVSPLGAIIVLLVILVIALDRLAFGSGSLKTESAFMAGLRPRSQSFLRSTT